MPLDLYEATLDSTWIEWADILQKRQNELFWDPQNFGYFTASADDDSIILRLKEDQGENKVKYEVLNFCNENFFYYIEIIFNLETTHLT